MSHNSPALDDFQSVVSSKHVPGYPYLEHLEWDCAPKNGPARTRGSPGKNEVQSEPDQVLSEELHRKHFLGQGDQTTRWLRCAGSMGYRKRLLPLAAPVRKDGGTGGAAAEEGRTGERPVESAGSRTRRGNRRYKGDSFNFLDLALRVTCDKGYVRSGRIQNAGLHW